MALLGKPDPRLQSNGKLDLRLHRLLAGFKKVDPPPDRVQPASLAILAVLFTLASPTVFDMAVRDLCVIGFFFLCRPGEATAPTDPQSESEPFRLCDVELLIDSRFYRGDLVPLGLLDSAVGVRLEYTNQKNANRGEKIALDRSGNPHLCPVLATVRRVRHLRTHQAARDAPLYTVCTERRPLAVYARHLTSALQHAATLVEATTGIDPSKITARSLRPGGATALLCAGVDHDGIRLIGRWKSDAMIRYLHVQAATAMRHYSSRMLQHGTFTFNTVDLNPVQALPLIQAD